MSDLKIVMRRQHALNHSTVSDVQSSEPATATHVHPSCQRSSQPALPAPSLAEPHSAHPSHEKKESPTPQWPSNTTSILAQNTRRIASSRCSFSFTALIAQVVVARARLRSALININVPFFPFVSSPPTRCGGGLSAQLHIYTYALQLNARVKVCTVRDSGSIGMYSNRVLSTAFSFYLFAPPTPDARYRRALGPLCPFLVVFVGSWGRAVFIDRWICSLPT